jgi:hypothetical protein
MKSGIPSLAAAQALAQSLQDALDGFTYEGGIAERDALKAQLADAAKVSDGVWEWVPKPKYDTLKAENVMLKEQIQKALKRLDEASEEGCLHTSIIATFMRRPDLDYEPLGEILDATKEGE